MSFLSHACRAARFRSAAAALAVVGALTIAGCGGGGGTPGPVAGTLAPTSAASALPADASTGTGTGTGDCGEATAAAIARGLTDFGNFTVTTDGGCHDATIVTTLTDVTKALAICDAAAKIGYPAGDISSITVTGANGKELSIGVKGQECIGEP